MCVRFKYLFGEEITVNILMETKQKWVAVNVNIPEPQALQISNLVKQGRYATISDFVREAIRHSLKEERNNGS